MNATTALLGLIAVKPSYGYDLKQEYDRLFGGEKPLAFGQVYSTLGRLARDERVEVKQQDSDEGPDRKQYQITAKGQQAVFNWLSTPELPQPHLQSELFAKVVLSLMLGENTRQFLDIQRSAHIERMRQINHERKQYDLAYMLLADHALYHIEADIRWIDLTESRLNNLKQELNLC